MESDQPESVKVVELAAKQNQDAVQVLCDYSKSLTVYTMDLLSFCAAHMPSILAQLQKHGDAGYSSIDGCNLGDDCKVPSVHQLMLARGSRLTVIEPKRYPSYMELTYALVSIARQRGDDVDFATPLMSIWSAGDNAMARKLERCKAWIEKRFGADGAPDAGPMLDKLCLL